MMSRYATFARSLIKVAALLGPIALATTPAAPALADSGPQRVIYIFPGVRDTGGNPATGVATVVHCFSFSPSQETMQFVVRNSNGAQVGVTITLAITQFQTVTVVTHATALYDADFVDATGSLEGAVGISASSSNIVCTAQIVDASASVPSGIALHAVRFNPISGSAE